MMALTTKNLAFILVAISAIALIVAFIAQYAFNLPPCVLCIYQRIPYAIVILLGLATAFAPAAYARRLLVLCGLLFLTGAGLAAFHVGVEQQWWEGTSSCGINIKGRTIEELREQILNAPRVRCSDIAWSLFGISMAGYNALMSLALSFATFWFIGKKKGL